MRKILSLPCTNPLQRMVMELESSTVWVNFCKSGAHSMKRGVLLGWHGADLWLKWLAKDCPLILLVCLLFFEVDPSCFFIMKVSKSSLFVFVLQFFQKVYCLCLENTVIRIYFCFPGSVVVFARDTQCSGILTGETREFLREVIYIWYVDVNSVKYRQKTTPKAEKTKSLVTKFLYFFSSSL